MVLGEMKVAMILVMGGLKKVTVYIVTALSKRNRRGRLFLSKARRA
jgi:hypothetical protein